MSVAVRKHKGGDAVDDGRQHVLGGVDPLRAAQIVGAVRERDSKAARHATDAGSSCQRVPPRTAGSRQPTRAGGGTARPG
jgi:hypothetical protein